MIKSLLELQKQRAAQQARVMELAKQDLTDSVEFANAEWNLRQTEKLIKNWGTEQAVYRIY